jgi:hypothetical protein
MIEGTVLCVALKVVDSSRGASSTYGRTIMLETRHASDHVMGLKLR